jgi:DNA-binding XRE family transcriptional regulator
MTFEIISLSNCHPLSKIIAAMNRVSPDGRALLARLEDLQDIADAKSARTEETFPVELIERLMSGESPLKVWRDYRNLTLQALAAQCGVTRQMLSMIEHGKANPSADLLAKLAHALQCDMDDLHH